MESDSVILARRIPAGRRLWLWPNLLSLDAPLVAVVWQFFFVRCFHGRVNAVSSALLMLAVWLIYAADRMLDAWSTPATLPRHEFYRRHWRAVLPVWSAGLALATWLAWTRLPAELFERGSVIAAAVGLYFVLVHFLRPGHRLKPVPPGGDNVPHAWHRLQPVNAGSKELAVAILFALGASVAAWGAIDSPADIETIALFSCLCWINCVAIEQWEHRASGWPVAMAAMLVMGAAVLTYTHRPVVSAAEIASALAFVALDQERRRFSRDALRVLADVALLTPVLFLPVNGLLR